MHCQHDLWKDWDCGWPCPWKILKPSRFRWFSLLSNKILNIICQALRIKIKLKKLYSQQWEKYAWKYKQIAKGQCLHGTFKITVRSQQEKCENTKMKEWRAWNTIEHDSDYLMDKFIKNIFSINNKNNTFKCHIICI